MSELEQALMNAARDGIREGLTKRLSSNYSNPLDKVIDNAVLASTSELSVLASDAIRNALTSEGFKGMIEQAIRAQLAKQLVARIGGELEKQVNALKSDPATRARITVAIDEIIKSKS